MDSVTAADNAYQAAIAAADKHYSAVKDRLPEHWQNHDLVASALDGVELDRGQARSLAALLSLARYAEDKAPAVLIHAVREIVHSFDELLIDYVFESTTPEDYK